MNIPEIFGLNVFNDATMKEKLSEETFKTLKNCIASDEHLPIKIANEIATAMKDWAITLGATHFSHWFHPLTGITAEKHDSFIAPSDSGKIIMEFSGKELIKGEPDASSFPNGGLRATFEARGYTAWDPSSPVFVKDTTLYIPTLFFSYNGDILDKKTPLLRSVDALEKAATRIIKFFPEFENVKNITPTVGAEQEYFLVDKNVYEKRLDLQHCGRTLFGAPPPRGQGMTYHYFGAIRPRVAEFMKELDTELWKLGVLSKTRHNEAAPSQHELAPIFETTNIAVDHNQLIMDTMKRIAAKHDLVCLLHEKPFEWVNGSGKHINWSLSTDSGKNMLSPGKNPETNYPFLLFLVAVIRAVDEYQNLMRITISSASNDLRLGGNEAPPSIISIYLGDELTNILENFGAIESKKQIKEKLIRSQQNNSLNFDSDIIPEFHTDTADRNRTSPFAFTGNKFEFRMCGSSASIAGPNMVINSAVADILSKFAHRLETSSNPQLAIKSLIKKTYTEHKRIVFNGNNYSAEWVKEAKKRGLSVFFHAPEAIAHYTDEKNVLMFENQKVLSRREIAMRQFIKTDSYCKNIEIEVRTMLCICKKTILNSLFSYQKSLAETIDKKRNASTSLDLTPEYTILENISKLSNNFYKETENLSTKLSQSYAITNLAEKSKFCCDVLRNKMNELRVIIDEIEGIVSSDNWSLPTYEKLLFSIGN